jgi:hypothetical protein
MQGVRERLRAAGELDPVVAARLDELQIFCINQVSDPTAREALICFLAEVAPIQFFVSPASRGQHHPKWQNERGGIIRNTLECCLGVDRKMRAFPQLLDPQGHPLPRDRDILLIATIISDTFKHVDLEGEWKGFSHHRIAAEKWEELASRCGLESTFSKKVYDAIFWHLGRFTPEWDPNWTDPSRDLDLHAFLVHMLDMDFSNKDLERIFLPKSPLGAHPGKGEDEPQVSSSHGKAAVEFLGREFEAAHSYFLHIENKLSNLVTFYGTLFVATVSACYYIFTSDAFNGMRLFALAGAGLVFFLLGLFILGMYTELRIRKIKILEQLAAIREFFSTSKAEGKGEIGSFLILITGIDKCPPYLRRPSEDWYSILLMIFLNSLGLTFAVSSIIFGLKISALLGSGFAVVVGIVIAGILFACTFYLQFKWTTLFALTFDCEREVRYRKTPAYDLFNTIPDVIPRGLRWLEIRASKIEDSNRNRILMLVRERHQLDH